MSKKSYRATSPGAAAIVLVLGAGSLGAQFNPNGWIQTDGWNYLMPLTQDGGCTGGGSESLRRNWIAPHEIGSEDPKGGTSYSSESGDSARIDFGGAAASTGWGGQVFANDPTWVTNGLVEIAYSSLALDLPNGDLVDYQGICDYLNANVVPVAPGSPPSLPGDGVLAIATTYVRNTTGAGLQVEVCIASDDSGQLWVNDILLASESLCAANMNGNSYRAILPPGLTKIATLVWEGGGGWGFRLGIRVGGVLITDATAAAAGLEFIGPGASEDVGQIQYRIARSFRARPFNCPGETAVEVCLRGSGPGADEDTVIVEETVLAASPADIEFSALPVGASISDVLSPPGRKVTIPAKRADLNAGTVCYSIGYNANGSVAIDGVALSATIVQGPGTLAFAPSQVDPDGPGGFDNSHDIGGAPTAGSTTFAGGVYTQTGSGNDIWDGGDQFQYAYKAVTGDFIATARITSRTDPVSGGRWGKHGLMSRWTCDQNSKYSMIQANLATPGDVIDEPRYAFRINHLDNGSNRDHYIVDDGTFANRLPTWMRLIRRGDAVYGYFAEDVDANDEPDNWCLIGSDSSVNMPDTVLVGMALTSHAGAVTGTITYDNLTIEAGADCGDASCTIGEELTTIDFEAPDGTNPADGGLIVVQGGTFAPVITGGRLRLSQEGIGSIANAVWGATDPLLLGDAGFVVEFDAFMSHATGSRAADGMTFAVVQGNAAFAPGLRGDGGGALGYEGNTLLVRTECHPSFAIELDSWVGGGEPGNELPDGGYHVGLDVNASVSSIQTNVEFGVPTGALPPIFDADGVHVEVQYSASGNVNVFVSDGTVQRTQVISACVEPLAGEVLIGFTAGTGGATATQEVDNVVVSSVCCEDAEMVTIEGATQSPIGIPLDLTATSGGLDGAATYTWSIESGPGTITPSGSTAIVEAVSDGDVMVKVVVDDGVCGGSAEDTHAITFGHADGIQKPNDFNGDGNLDISDPIALLDHMFAGSAGPPCDGGLMGVLNLWVLDANASGAIDISDAVFVLNFLFLGGPTPANCSGDVTCPCLLTPGADCPATGGCP